MLLYQLLLFAYSQQYNKQPTNKQKKKDKSSFTDSRANRSKTENKSFSFECISVESGVVWVEEKLKERGSNKIIFC